MRIISILIIIIFLMGCNNNPFKRYKRQEAEGIASGKRTDSLFFGIYLGMPVKDFYTHCWQMNKNGTLTDGLNNQFVLYKLNHQELKHPASMNFYPDFAKDKIVKMRVAYQYDGWAPWNKAFYADSLLPDVVALYKKWYSTGNDFLKINDPKKGDIYVKVDNNRRITIGKYDDMMVKVDLTDLLAVQEIKKSAAKQ